jgi:16S rRNA processing protein RimM
VIAPPDAEEGERYELASARRMPSGVVIALAGVATREQAEALRGHAVMVARGDLAATGENEFYDCDLQGMEVRTADGTPLGRVVAVEHPPANDVLVVALAGRDAFLDVPMVEGIVLGVALDDGAITVDVPDGLPARARR